MSEEEAGLAMLRKLSGSDEYEAQARKTAEELNAERRAGAEADKRAFEEEVAARGVLGAEREKRLKGQEEKLAASEGKNLKMTLIEAGLAIMGGQSPNAFANIAAGAAAGLKGYQGRLDRIEEGRAKIDDAMNRLDDLRREEAISTGAEKRAYASQIRKAELEGKMAMAGVLKDAYGTKAKQAETAAEMAFKRREAAASQATQLAVAQTYAARSGGGGGGGAAPAVDKEQLRTIRNELAAARSAAKNAMYRDKPAAQAKVAELEQLEKRMVGLLTGDTAAAPVNSGGTPGRILDFNKL